MNRMIFPAVLAAALLGNVFNSGHSARADEPQCQQCEIAVPILSKIPYVGRLFRNVAVAGDDCERIGVDFEFQISDSGFLPAPGQSATCPTAQCQAMQCQAMQCQAAQCEAISFPRPTNHLRSCNAADGAGPGCPVATCNAAGCAACPGGVCCPPGYPGVGSQAILAEVEMQSNMLQMYGEFLEEIDVLRERLNDEKQQLAEALIASSVENAKLTAQLEAAKETTKLAIENAVLKEKLAVATGTSPGNQQLAKKLAKKNAALQAKVEKLELKVAEFAKTNVEVAEKTTVKK